MAVTRRALREEIKDALLERILEGRLAPGERIVETRVAQEFGVSQAPVREALRELESLRLVVTEPHRGARVREVTTDELREIYPVRAALEDVAARAAAARLDGDASVLAAELDAMLAAADAGDVARLVAHDVAFHRLVVHASANRTLQDLWGALHVHARTTITYLAIEDLHAVAESHRPVLDALAARDAEAAGRAMREHIESFARLIRAPGAG
jgi:DNA-binding GntR family transcriptional regulator